MSLSRRSASWARPQPSPPRQRAALRNRRRAPRVPHRLPEEWCHRRRQAEGRHRTAPETPRHRDREVARIPIRPAASRGLERRLRRFRDDRRHPADLAQAAGADLVYAATIPQASSAVLVPEGSSIASVVALKGKKIAFTKGSSSHNFIVQVLKKAGIAYTEVTPVNLSPADAAAAFARGSVDAWTIWDPFFAARRKKSECEADRPHRRHRRSHSFYLANGTFAKNYPPHPQGGDRRTRRDRRLGGNEPRRSRGDLGGGDCRRHRGPTRRRRPRKVRCGPLTSEAIANQQLIADEFYRLGLIPKSDQRPGRRLDATGRELRAPIGSRSSTRNSHGPRALGRAGGDRRRLAGRRSTALSSTRVHAGAERGVRGRRGGSPRSGELLTHIGSSFARAAHRLRHRRRHRLRLRPRERPVASSERLTDTTSDGPQHPAPRADPAGHPVVRHRGGGEALPRGARRVLPDLRQHSATAFAPSIRSSSRWAGLRHVGGELFLRVILPGALPSVFVGVRYALGIMWLTLIVAETIAANRASATWRCRRASSCWSTSSCSSILHLRAARQARRQPRAPSRTRVLAWHPAFQTLARRASCMRDDYPRASP